MKTFFVMLLAVMAVANAQTPSARAHALVSQMTIDEKITMVTGHGGNYVGNVPAIPRLSIPALNMNDGPQGFRSPGNAGGTSTQMPCGLAIGATWEPNNAYLWGKTMGTEFYQKGSNVQLGPGMCVARVPRNGRNFEYISGEDPFLGATMVGPAIQGIQRTGVIANAKHYINNNQETDRTTISENIDERTRMEIYQPPFAASVKAGVYSIMCSYNKINNVYACENNQTLNTELKGLEGFPGWVMSDWGATHSTIDAALNGLDQEMPDGRYFGAALKGAIQNGTVPQSALDDKVYRILYSMIASGVFDLTPSGGNAQTNVTSEQHNTIARELAVAGTILLKNNNNLLPLDATKITSVAVFNKPAGSAPITGGGGSGSVVPYYQSTVLDALYAKLNPDAPARSANCTYDPGYDYYQPGNPQVIVSSKEECCAACSARPWCNAFTFSNSVCWLKNTDEGRTLNPALISGKCPPVPYGKVKITYYEGSNVEDAAAIAASADVAITVLATTSSEGSDRTSLDLPEDQVAVTEAVGKANKNTISVIITPGAVLTNFTDNVAAALVMFMPGQEEGNAAVQIMFGQEPAGRLPLTFPNYENEIGFTPQQWPGVNLQADYTEKLNVGYRWYAAHQVAPKWAFGHGLSYANFSYSSLNIDASSYDISFNLQNTASVSGLAAPQVYVKYPDHLGEPPLNLKGFTRVHLTGGQTKTVTINIAQSTSNQHLLATWDATNHVWVTPQSGDVYTIMVGESSGDLRLTGTLTVA